MVNCRRRRQNYVLAQITVHTVYACRIRRKARTMTAISLQRPSHFVMLLLLCFMLFLLLLVLCCCRSATGRKLYSLKSHHVDCCGCGLHTHTHIHTVVGVSVIVAVASWLPTRKFVVFGIFTTRPVKKRQRK